MSIQQNALSVEQRIKNIFNKVLDIPAEEIQSDAKLDQSLGIDSTEMVEISVAIKKEFSVPIADSELKKSHSLNEIVEILKAKGIN